jgi:hypothetical protein
MTVTSSLNHLLRLSRTDTIKSQREKLFISIKLQVINSTNLHLTSVIHIL